MVWCSYAALIFGGCITCVLFYLIEMVGYTVGCYTFVYDFIDAFSKQFVFHGYVEDGVVSCRRYPIREIDGVSVQFLVKRCAGTQQVLDVKGLFVVLKIEIACTIPSLLQNAESWRWECYESTFGMFGGVLCACMMGGGVFAQTDPGFGLGFSEI